MRESHIEMVKSRQKVLPFKGEVMVGLKEEYRKGEEGEVMEVRIDDS